MNRIERIAGRFSNGRPGFTEGIRIVCAGLAMALGLAQLASGQTYELVKGFEAPFVNGASPSAGLIQTADGSFYGTTVSGGSSDFGTVFRLDGAGRLTTLHSFTGGSDGKHPYGRLLKATDGHFYGTTSSGGASNSGTIFVFDHLYAGGGHYEFVLRTLHTFTGGTDGGLPRAGLIQATDGKFYGTTAYGGLGDGTVFKIDGAGTLTTLYNFNGTSGGGKFPHAPLVQGTDGRFYGTTRGGGNFDRGIVFTLSAVGTLTGLHSFTSANCDECDGSEGEWPYAGLVQAADGNFYGTTASGGAFGRGTVFRFDGYEAPVTVYSFNLSDGRSPRTSLIQAADGGFYGTTFAGGAANGGTVFKLDLVGNLTTLHPFTGGSDGRVPAAELLQAADGSFYGTTSYGAASNVGTIFKLDGASTLTTLHTFTGGSDGGATPFAGVVQASDGSLYGTTSDGGLGLGTVFKLDSAGTSTTLQTFTGSDGASPYFSALVQATDGAFYGTTSAGGASALGTVFKINWAGTLTTLHSFSGSDGAYPYSGVLQATDSAFYGTTNRGGAAGLGTVFKINGAGTLTTLHTFSGITGGWYPAARLVQGTDGSFYGTTTEGGTSNRGTIFKIGPTGTFTTLHSFTGAGGDHPWAALIQATDGSFYGTTVRGGPADQGTVFKLDASGTVTILHAFATGPGGRLPYAGLVQAADGSLYGTTSAGGSSDRGTVFAIEGTGAFTTVHTFTGSDGSSPTAALIQSADGTFYGTTSAGGPSGGGTVFKLTPANRAPIANGQSVATAENTAAGIVLTASDDDGDLLTFTVLTAPAHGQLTGTAPNLTYTPAANYTGSDSFTFKVNDGTADSTAATVAITVAAANDAPVANNQTVQTAEDGAKSITLTASDADGDPLTFVIVTSPSHGTLSGTAPNLTYIPAANYVGADSFTFKVNDGTVDSAVATVSAFVGPLTTLHSFGSGSDGAYPYASVVQATDGNFYGTTVYGGASGLGTVFKLDATGTLTTLYAFTGGSDGGRPYAGLIQASDGSFYGTTIDGGASNFGTVFKLNAAGTLTTLHSFTGGSGGLYPYARLVQATDGSFYGTTNYGGASALGTVFKLDGAGTFTTIHAFTGGSEGGSPYSGGLMQATDGSLYGTTLYGGSGYAGTIFRLDVAAGTLTTIYRFTGGTDGVASYGGLIQAADGNFYGTSLQGGASDFGTIFKLDAAGTLTTLHHFTGGTDGGSPYAGVVQATDGSFYGTTHYGGGSDRGKIFKLDGAGTLTTLYAFAGSDGASLYAGLIQATDGSFYGTTVEGGAFGAGTVFRLAPAVNHTPIANDQPAATPEDTATGIVLTGSDADNDSLTFTIVTAPAHGALSGSAPNLTYTPAANYSGPDGFTFTVNDGTVDSAPATVSVTVTAVNDPPVASAQAVSTGAGTAIPITLTGSDPEGDALTFATVAVPSHGTLSGSAPNLTYTPAASYSGPDSFTFKANDGTADSGVATVAIDVVATPLAVTLTAPNGGEKLFVNLPFTIRWTGAGANSFDLAFSRNGGTSYTAIAACTGLPGSATSCLWTPTGTATAAALIRVTARNAGGATVVDGSNGTFAIATGAPVISVTAPNTVVSWAVGSTRALTWTHNLGANSTVRVELSRDDGISWDVLAAPVSNSGATTGTFPWVVSGPATATARVRVTQVDGPATDTSNVAFSIVAPAITVTAPNTNVSWKIGTAHSVTWNHNLGTAESVRIESSPDNGATWALVAANVPNTTATSGTFSWNVRGPATTRALIRVSRISDSAVQDVSNVPFAVTSRIAVTSPNTVVTWGAGSTRTITWTHDYGAAQAFDLYLSADNGASWVPIASAVPSATATSGTYTGALPATVTTQALVGVSPAGNFVDGDVSNVPFRLAAPLMRVSVPNTNVGWVVGSTRSITWAHNLGQSDAVNIEVSRDGGATWTPIASNVANSASTSGTFGWVVTGPPTLTARIRVTWVANGAVQDVSNVNFRIQ